MRVALLCLALARPAAAYSPLVAPRRPGGRVIAPRMIIGAEILTDPNQYAAVGVALAGVAALGATRTPTSGWFAEAPYAPGPDTYDPSKADAFYARKWPIVLGRMLRLTYLTAAFNIKLLLDWKLERLEQNQAERAKEALALATQLGPTFIKLAQALSIRTDLIPEAYALEFRQLQVRSPPAGLPPHGMEPQPELRVVATWPQRASAPRAIAGLARAPR